MIERSHRRLTGVARDFLLWVPSGCSASGQSTAKRRDGPPIRAGRDGFGPNISCTAARRSAPAISSHPRIVIPWRPGYSTPDEIGASRRSGPGKDLRDLYGINPADLPRR